MKKLYLLITIFAINIFTLKAQVSDLSELASGDLEIFTPITESNGDIYGYLTIYKLEDVSKTEEKYEYVLLDKNLNKLANGEFVDTKYKKHNSKFYYPEKIGNNLIISKLYYFSGERTVFRASIEDYSFVSHRFININENKLSEAFYYKEGNFVDGYRDVKIINKIASKEKTIDYPLVFSGGFFMFEKIKSADKIKNLKSMTSLRAYNVEKKSIWNYDYNKENKKIKYKFKVLNDESIIFWTKEDKTKSEKLHRLEPKTGAPIFVYELEDRSSDYSHNYVVNIIDDKTIITGSYSSYKAYAGFEGDKSLGFFKIVLDREGKEVSKTYKRWEEFSSKMEIKKNGKMKKGYRLYNREIFAFSDGRTSILTRKIKSRDFSNLVLLNFDTEFNLETVKVIENNDDDERLLPANYLFSQNRENRKKASFFYKKKYKIKGFSAFGAYGLMLSSKKKIKEKLENKNKDAYDKLGIITVNEGQVNIEEVQMVGGLSGSVYPFIAKEGYILLREFNKDSDYDQIRLERLNY